MSPKNWVKSRQTQQNYLEEARRFSRYFEELASKWKSIKIPTSAEWDNLREDRKRAALLLAKRGWFIHFEMTLGELNALFSKIESGQEEEVESIIEAGLEARLVLIESKLISWFPDLTAILAEAFDLHKNPNTSGRSHFFFR